MVTEIPKLTANGRSKKYQRSVNGSQIAGLVSMMSMRVSNVIKGCRSNGPFEGPVDITCPEDLCDCTELAVLCTAVVWHVWLRTLDRREDVENENA